MKSCNRVIVTVLLCIGLSPGCGAETPDATTAVIQDVGLVATSSTPPLGEGVAPLSGTGGDGSPSVPGKGIAEGGPGAVRWYGGQWLIPYSGRPGSTVQNVSCDVIPNAQSTDLIELVGPAGVIGSVTVPAVSGVTIRAWITTPHTIADGEVIVIRHSPRDVATGDWTTGVEQMTIIGCAVNATRIVTIPVAINGPRVGPGPGFQGDALYMSGPVQSAVFQIAGLPVGSTLRAARVRVRDSAIGPTPLNAIIYPSLDGIQGSSIAISPTSAGNGQPQTLPIAGLSTIIAPLTTYSIYVNMTAGSAQVSVVGIDVDYQPPT